MYDMDENQFQKRPHSAIDDFREKLVLSHQIDLLIRGYKTVATGYHNLAHQTWCGPGTRHDGDFETCTEDTCINTRLYLQQVKGLMDA
jgi:hypothetical protein